MRFHRLQPLHAGLLALLLVSFPATAKDSPLDVAFDSIEGPEALAHVRHLASDEMEGRGLGSAGELAAARYLGKKLEAYGLRPAGDDGTWFQSFTAFPSVELGAGNRLRIRLEKGPLDLEAGKDYEPFGYSPDGKVEAPLVFGGYGIVAKEPARDDYRNLEVRGRVVVVLRRGWSVVKARSARERGAAGLIVVNDPLGAADELDALVNDAAVEAGIPVLQLRAEAGKRLFERAGQDLAALRKRVDEKLETPALSLGATCELDVRLTRKGTATRNVLGLLPGKDPKLGKETVVLAAHYDHLGRGGFGSLAPEREGEIHNGADDNASGVSVLLEVAEALHVSGLRPPRTVLFALFSGEEYGNLGSKHYVEHPVAPLARTVAMINLDTVGRGTRGRFAVWGVGTATGLGDVLERAEAEVERRTGVELAVRYGPQDPGAGDNAAFFRRGIPAVLFHTGRTPQYHTPDDDWKLIEKESL
ncbi:MAG: M20/M25/M40 family metallo-hydrolase, partial [Planctomycetota bacterium]